MEKEKGDDIYLKELYKCYTYSIEQFDKAILFVSSGSLILSTTFIEKIVPLASCTNKIFLIMSWVLEVLTILLFTINHYLSMRSLCYEIEEFHSDSKNKKEITVQNINVISIITLVSGLVSLIIFISLNIK